MGLSVTLKHSEVLGIVDSEFWHIGEALLLYPELLGSNPTLAIGLTFWFRGCSGATGNVSCSLCPAGTYQTASGSIKVCTSTWKSDQSSSSTRKLAALHRKCIVFRVWHCIRSWIILNTVEEELEWDIWSEETMIHFRIVNIKLSCPWLQIINICLV